MTVKIWQIRLHEKSIILTSRPLLETLVFSSKYQLIALRCDREDITMRTLKCLCCKRQIQANPKLENQKYCGRTACQQARKRNWQHNKIATDPDYQENQRNAQKQWQERNPDYWHNYRRNRQKPPPAAPNPQGAKMDTLTPNSHLISGEYLISPVKPSGIKMDAILVKIIPVSKG